MYKITAKFVTILLVASLFVSCTKDVPKELLNKQNSQNNQQNGRNNQQQMPNDSIHRNLSQNNSGDTKSSNDNTQNDTKGDPKAEQMVKEADDADAQYQKSKSEQDKKQCITKQMAAANYLMFDANLSPKKKYRPALQRYNRVLELDPKHPEAMENKKQIEDIYQSMGMPIPN
jgi:tetratricopeptide (TPR) repeat protein